MIKRLQRAADADEFGRGTVRTAQVSKLVTSTTAGPGDPRDEAYVEDGVSKIAAFPACWTAAESEGASLEACLAVA